MNTTTERVAVMRPEAVTVRFRVLGTRWLTARGSDRSRDGRPRGQRTGRRSGGFLLHGSGLGGLVQDLPIQLLEPAELLHPLIEGERTQRWDVHRTVQPVGGLTGPEVEVSAALGQQNI